MNLSKFIVVIWSAIGLASCGNGFSVLGTDPQPGSNKPSALVSEPQPGKSGRRTFADWCLARANLTPEAKHTVEVLLDGESRDYRFYLFF